MTHALSQTTQFRSDFQNEVLQRHLEAAQRLQAQRDLAIIVENSAKGVREGVSKDLRKIPLNVQVNGQPAAANQNKLDQIATSSNNGAAVVDRAPRKHAPATSIDPWIQEATAWWKSVETFLGGECKPPAVALVNNTGNMITMTYFNASNDDRVQSAISNTQHRLNNLTELLKHPDFCP